MTDKLWQIKSEQNEEKNKIKTCGILQVQSEEFVASEDFKEWLTVTLR